MSLYMAQCAECNAQSHLTGMYGYTIYWREQHAMATGHANMVSYEVLDDELLSLMED